MANILGPLALDKDFIDKRNALAKELGGYDGDIDARVDYIVRKICDVFGKDLDWYEYQGGSGDDGSGGTFDTATQYDDEQLGIDFNFDRNDYNTGWDMPFIDRNGEEWR